MQTDTTSLDVTIVNGHVASVCTPPPTLSNNSHSGQRDLELMRPFARSLSVQGSRYLTTRSQPRQRLFLPLPVTLCNQSMTDLAQPAFVNPLVTFVNDQLACNLAFSMYVLFSHFRPRDGTLD